MSNLQAYFHRQAETRAARAQADYASACVENALMRERLAELKSQHEPLATMARDISGENCLHEDYMKTRAAMYAAAFYAVVGRMPQEGEGVE